MCSIEDLTCHSMKFIGLPLPSDHIQGKDLENVLGLTEGVKVAVIDSAYESSVSPNEYDSFNNIPICQSVHNCKRETKLSSHGFLCASILAGKQRNANFYEFCQGTIRGVVPNAQLYIYAVGCTRTRCFRSPELLAKAINLAVKDEVRVISMSQGLTNVTFEDFDENWTEEIAKSTLEAYKKNILVCVPAGNQGPATESLLYGMPWCLNVGACTIGKNLVTSITIGTKGKVPSDVEILETRVDENFEEIRILDKVEGISMNIVESRFLLLRISNKLRKDREGILCASGDYITLKPVAKTQWTQLYTLNVPKWPTVTISRDNCRKLRDWFFKAGPIYLSISTSRYAEDKREIYVPEFSARGPSRFYPEIIMPDLVAPGCNILGSHSDNIPFASIMTKEGDSFEKKEVFGSQRIMTGTSLATPHIAGLFVALLSNRPEWSLAMAKSAAITTAWSFAENEIPGNEFMFGAGLMQLEQALNPVLVYDEGYNNFKSYFEETLGVDELNMPSFAASFTQSHEFCERRLKRALTNIDNIEVMFEAEIKFYHNSLDKDAILVVIPNVLTFKPGETKKFVVEVRLCPRPLGHISASLIWKETRTGHCVKSPIHLYHRSDFDRRLWYEKKKDELDETPVQEVQKQGIGRGKGKTITGEDTSKGKGKMSEEKTIGRKRAR
ncbi:hypothetical protein RND81_13G154800 [Saponaria officinalis]